MMGLLTFGVNQTINAQEEAPAIEEVAQEDSAAVDTLAAAEDVEAEDVIAEEEEDDAKGLHKTIKVKFIEGSAGFMALVAVAMGIQNSSTWQYVTARLSCL